MKESKVVKKIRIRSGKFGKKFILTENRKLVCN